MVLKRQLLMVAYSKQIFLDIVDCYKTNLYQSPGLVPTSEGQTGERWLRLHVLWCWDCSFEEVVIYHDKT